MVILLLLLYFLLQDFILGLELFDGLIVLIAQLGFLEFELIEFLVELRVFLFEMVIFLCGRFFV